MIAGALAFCLIALAVVLPLILGGHDKSPGEALVGKWRYPPNSAVKLTVTPSTMMLKSGTETLNMRYYIAREDVRMRTVVITMEDTDNAFVQDSTVTITFSEDWTEMEFVEETFVRVRPGKDSSVYGVDTT